MSARLMMQTYLYWPVTFLAEPSANRWRSMFPVRTPFRKTCEFEVLRPQNAQRYLGWNRSSTDGQRKSTMYSPSVFLAVWLRESDVYVSRKDMVQYDVRTYSRVRYPRVWSSPRVWRYVNRSLDLSFTSCGFDLHYGLSKGRPSAHRVREVL